MISVFEIYKKVGRGLCGRFVMGAICLVCLTGYDGWQAPGPGFCWAHEATGDATLLMFVGEDLDVLSIASRREESAWEAPAVAQVVPRETFRKWGVSTLSGILDQLPGFYLAPKEWGHQPYLRGIPDSILFLYDTIPAGSDTTKSYHPLDAELNLNAVKRVEVIRGPGSVLWGADAFAGIVNVVPMSGRDLDGVEIGVQYGDTQDDRGVYLNWGSYDGFTDAFLSVYARKQALNDLACNIGGFWGDGDTSDPVAIEDRYVDPFQPDTSTFAEVTGCLAYKDRLNASFRLADADRIYGATDSEGEIAWEEEKHTPHLLMKLEAKAEVSPVAAFRFLGSFSRLKTSHRIVDYTLRYHETVTYGEVLYDRSLFHGQGLFTGGVSCRGKQVTDAVIWQYYLPEYIKKSTKFPPLVERVDYSDDLYSVFSQYRQQLGPFDLWGGVRFDNHDSYQDNTSFSTGCLWSPTEKWNVKLQYGTAYRTPFSRQLLESSSPKLERIECVNVQGRWRPFTGCMFQMTLFDNQIDHHMVEDTYAGAGLSVPNHQRIRGGEIEWRYAPVPSLELSGNITVLSNTGPDEIYKYNDYTWVLPDGTVERHYTDLYFDYDTGPEALANMRMDWKITDTFCLGGRVRYIDQRHHIYALDSLQETWGSAWLTDVSARFQLGKKYKYSFLISVTDLFDSCYQYPATYYSVQTEGRTLKTEGRTLRLQYSVRF